MNKLSTLDSSSSSSNSVKNKNAESLSLSETINKNGDIQFLQKKICRNNFKNKFLDKKILNEKEVLEPKEKEKNIIENDEQRSGKSSTEEQTEITKKLNLEQNEETPTISDLNDNSLDKNTEINGINNYNNNKYKLNHDKIGINNNIHTNESMTQNHQQKKDPEVTSISSNNLNNQNINIQNKKITEEKKIDSNGFSEEENELSKKIELEFNSIMTSSISDTDKIIKLTTYIITNGFSEQVRYIFYKCLINFGYPFPKRFLQFYQYFNKYCESEKIKTPEKMFTQFYSEIILRMITIQKITPSKNKYISEFFFNGENVDLVINNLNLIKDIKDNITNNHYYVQNFLEQNYDILFKSMTHKINKDFSKSKAVLCKILSNIILRCDKNGYLNYRQLIANENVIFDGVKIKSQHSSKFNLRRMISLKIFGQEFTDKKFNTVLQDYFLHLFTIYKSSINNK